MTPSEQIAQMIEELPPHERESVIEYIHLLHGQSDIEKKYHESVLFRQ